MLDWQTIAVALALMLMFEGLLPLVAPQRWRAALRRLLALSDGQIRFIGLGSVAAGAVLLVLIG